MWRDAKIDKTQPNNKLGEYFSLVTIVITFPILAIISWIKFEIYGKGAKKY